MCTSAHGPWACVQFWHILGVGARVSCRFGTTNPPYDCGASEMATTKVAAFSSCIRLQEVL